MTDQPDDDENGGPGSGRHPSAGPAPLRAVPAEPASRSRRRRPAPGEDPGTARLLVAVGARPARWYRTPAEAVADARPLVDGTEPGDVVARAWTAEPAEGPPAWQLRRGPRRRLRWERPPAPGAPDGEPTPGSA
jgi:hypothetical protein